MDALIAYLVLGALAGTLAGLLGIGGGLVIVPVLAWTFLADGFPGDLSMQAAVGTSLATIVVTSISSVLGSGPCSPYSRQGCSRGRCWVPWQLTSWPVTPCASCSGSSS